MFANFFKPKVLLDDATRQKIIDDVLVRLELAKPLSAIVFGSFAEKRAGIDSDIDILVICADSETLRDTRQTIYSKLKGQITSVPVDFIFVTKDDYLRKKELGGICMTAAQEGSVIYGSNQW